MVCKLTMPLEHKVLLNLVFIDESSWV